MRKMLFVVLACVLSITAFSSSAMAAKGVKGAKGDHAEGRGVERIKEQLGKLDLSDDQTKKISDILDDARTKVQAALADAKDSGDKEAAKEKVKPIIRDATQKIMAELTPDQKTKFRAAMQEMREQRKAKSDGATTQPAA